MVLSYRSFNCLYIKVGKDTTIFLQLTCKKIYKRSLNCDYTNIYQRDDTDGTAFLTQGKRIIKYGNNIDVYPNGLFYRDSVMLNVVKHLAKFVPTSEM